MAERGEWHHDSGKSGWPKQKIYICVYKCLQHTCKYTQADVFYVEKLDPYDSHVADSELSKNPTCDQEKSAHFSHFTVNPSHRMKPFLLIRTFLLSWLNGVHWYSTFAPLICFHMLFVVVFLLIAQCYYCFPTAVSHSWNISRAYRHYRWVLIQAAPIPRKANGY